MHVIDAIQQRLTADETAMLQEIYEPRVVATPLSDARRHVCITREGEIRSYGYLGGDHVRHSRGRFVYLSSLDAGLSWKQHYAVGKMHACTYIPEWDTYVGTADGQFKTWEGGNGLWVLLSDVGPDDPDPTVIRLGDLGYGDTFQPQKSRYSERLWFTTQAAVGDELMIFFYFSDDRGHTWQERRLPAAPVEELGQRWCRRSGVEPYAAELDEGRMLMLIRTPNDCFYQSISTDGGDTWSAAQPSTFYGRNTTPYMLPLRDGRTIAFWNNTRPLPIPDYNGVNYPVAGGVLNGTGESGFTNRDAAHAAITADGGRSWVGYREFLLNPIRNRPDFRYYGGLTDTLDKSVHQFQAFELPYGKILVCAGQNAVSRRLVIFDVNWLYETARTEDFNGGLEGVSAHTFVKSYFGSTGWTEAHNGHCAYNRAPSAYLMPDPEGGYCEHLYICRQPDERYFSDVGGVTWNFPAAAAGRVTLELLLTGAPLTLSLTDRWNAPCDATASANAVFTVTLEPAVAGKARTTVTVDYDLSAGTATVRADDRVLTTLAAARPCPTGISYLLAQVTAGKPAEGAYLRRMQAERI